MSIDAEKKILELVSLPSENEVVEFKEANADFDFRKLGKYFSALSNEANLKNVKSAWLVFGVRDSDHTFVNTNYRTNPTHLQSVKAEIGRKTTNGVSFIDIYEFEPEPGKRVVMFQIPPAPLGMPIAFENHYYAREHDSLVAMSLEKIDRIRSQGPTSDWSIQTITGATINDLLPEAIVRARELYKVKHPELTENVDKWDDKKFLNKAKITVEGRITHTAILLLGRPESVHFLNPAVSKITWILKKGNGEELDYEHFTSPFVITVDKLYAKIRNLKYRYISEGSLFPEEVSTYEPAVIREALNNCIAHQDYTLAGKINIVESQDSTLIFTNSGSFLPGTIENVIKRDSPSEFYRNRFLSDAMVNLNMIDTIGSGIRRMFLSQKNRYFPLPEYDITSNQVKVTIIGKVLDTNYARKLATIPELSLETIMLLDKVQKHKSLNPLEAKKLRDENLIEGKRPNIYISSKVASKTDEMTDYMDYRGIEDDYIKKMIMDFLEKFGNGTKAQFEAMLLPKLSQSLTDEQKRNKIKNILQSLKKDDEIDIVPGTKSWYRVGK